MEIEGIRRGISFAAGFFPEAVRPQVKDTIHEFNSHVSSGSETNLQSLIAPQNLWKIFQRMLVV